MEMEGYIDIVKMIDLKRGKDKEQGLKVIEKIKSYVEKINGFNAMPEPYCEISIDDFIYLTGLRKPIAIEFRQIDPKYFPEHPEKVFHDTYIFYYNDYAIAVVYPSMWGIDDSKVMKIRYNHSLRYYLIGKKVYQIRKCRRDDNENRCDKDNQ